MNIPSITDWIQALGVLLGVPTVVWGIFKLFRKDKEREAELSSLRSIAESQSLAIDEMRSQLMELKKQRLADMAWRVFESYSSHEMAEARQLLSLIEDNFNSAKEYQEKYHDQDDKTEEKKQDKKIRVRLRFYHQVGLLLKRRLVDRNLLFGLIGAGLSYDHKKLDMIAQSSRTSDKHPSMLSMYKYFDELWDEYRDWEKAEKPV